MNKNSIDLSSVPHLADNLEQALDSAPSLDKRLDRTMVPPELLGRACPGRLIRYCLTDWAWIGIFWMGMALTPLWLYPLWAILIAGRLHAFGVILHDATHMSIRKKTWQIYIVEILAGYPIASTLNAMRYHHLRHHRDTGMKTDPYSKPKLAGRPFLFMLIWLRHLLLIPLWSLRAPYGLMALFFPRLRNSYARIFLADRSGEDLTNNRELIDCTRAETGQVIVQILMLIVAFVYPYAFLSGFLIPVFIAALLAGHRVLVEHTYDVSVDRSMTTIIATTVDHNLGPFGRLLFAPRNIGHHIVHHLHPQVSLENLPALRNWYLDKHADVYPKRRPGGWIGLE